MIKIINKLIDFNKFNLICFKYTIIIIFFIILINYYFLLYIIYLYWKISFIIYQFPIIIRLYGVGVGCRCCCGHFNAIHLFDGSDRIRYLRSPNIAALVAPCGCRGFVGPDCHTVSSDHRGWIWNNICCAIWKSNPVPGDFVLHY